MNNTICQEGAVPKSILVVSVSQHLHGVPIDNSIREDWAKDKANGVGHHFANVGFDLDPNNIPETLAALRHALQQRLWNGIIIGWCLRGTSKFTVLFEQVVMVCLEGRQPDSQTKIMFSTGKDNLVETVVRNFQVGGGL